MFPLINFQAIYQAAQMRAEQDDVFSPVEHRLAYQHPQTTLFLRLMRHVFEVAFLAGRGVVLDAAGVRLVAVYSQPQYGGFRQVEDEEQIRLASPGCTPMFVAAGDVAERMANIS
jgi:hypothetical protein